jgi:hypothetical protein
MQKAYDNVVSPANIAKTILGELKGFNPFNLLKHSFWYLAGLFMFSCSFSWMLRGAKTAPWTEGWVSLGAFKK